MKCTAEEKGLEAIENALLATGRFIPESCSEVAECIMLYINDAGIKMNENEELEKRLDELKEEIYFKTKELGILDSKIKMAESKKIDTVEKYYRSESEYEIFYYHIKKEISEGVYLADFLHTLKISEDRYFIFSMDCELPIPSISKNFITTSSWGEQEKKFFECPQIEYDEKIRECISHLEKSLQREVSLEN